MKSRTRKRVLKGITAASFMGFLLAACCADSDSDVPLIVCVICAGWLLLISVANAR